MCLDPECHHEEPERDDEPEPGLKVKVRVPTWEEREIEIPSSCPACKVDLLSGVHVRARLSATADGGLGWDDDNEPIFKSDGAVKTDAQPADVFCGNCGRSFVPSFPAVILIEHRELTEGEKVVIARMNAQGFPRLLLLDADEPVPVPDTPPVPVPEELRCEHSSTLEVHLDRNFKAISRTGVDGPQCTNAVNSYNGVPSRCVDPECPFKGKRICSSHDCIPF